MVHLAVQCISHIYWLLPSLEHAVQWQTIPILQYKGLVFSMQTNGTVKETVTGLCIVYTNLTASFLLNVSLFVSICLSRASISALWSHLHWTTKSPSLMRLRSTEMTQLIDHHCCCCCSASPSDSAFWRRPLKKFPNP